MLLDGSTCEKLVIVKRINEVNIKEDPKSSFDPKMLYPEVFNGLGNVKIPYKIRLKEDAAPYALTTPRRIPLPLLDEIKSNLEEMRKMNVMERVDESTDWCSGLVLVPKSGRKIRMCVDYVHLNKYIRRENHPMPITDIVLGQLGEGKYFPKMDANHGFWQCILDEESQLLTTFITPFGRFKYKKLPFRISAAPEVFQKRMSQILDGIEGVLINVDDILVHGRTIKEHDEDCIKF